MKDERKIRMARIRYERRKWKENKEKWKKKGMTEETKRRRDGREKLGKEDWKGKRRWKKNTKN